VIVDEQPPHAVRLDRRAAALGSRVPGRGILLPHARPAARRRGEGELPLLNPPPEPISLPAVLDRALGQWGGDRRSEQARADQVTNGHLKASQYGPNSVIRTLARLDRDRPDLARYFGVDERCTLGPERQSA
jgi:hypothetical protein